MIDKEINEKIIELEKKMLKFELISTIQPNYSIGVHGINFPKNQNLTSQSENFLEIAKKIMKSGLKNFGSGGILSNVQMYGQLKDLSDQDFNSIFDYCYGFGDMEGNYVNILVAIPEVFIDKQGMEYYLGHFTKNENGVYAKYGSGSNLPLNRFVNEKRFLPKEFIVGYFVYNTHELEFFFTKNPEFIGWKSNEEQVEFFENIKEDLRKLSTYTKEDAEKLLKFLPSLSSNDYFLQLFEYYDMENPKKSSKI